MFRADVSNWSIVLHEVLIEQCSTQDSIKNSTHLPQSTISESLNLLIQNGYLAKKKIDGSRKVHYYPTKSLASLILRRFDRLDRYASSVISLLDNTINLIKTQKNREAKNLKSVLLEIKKGYRILQQYSNRMRYISMKKIYEKHKEGFQFL
jgi:predicted transcriptional regulator